MLRFAFVIGALSAFAAPAGAQNVRLAQTGALTFNLGGLFSSAPTAFDGVGIGGRYFLDEGMSLRGGLGISSISDSVEVNDNSSENSQNLFALEGGVEIVIARGKSAYLYTGGIAQLSSGSEDPDGSDNNTDNLGVTVAGLIGATYFVADSLSIGAEYRLGVSYTSTETESDERTVSRTAIGTGTVGFHLGFWFK